MIKLKTINKKIEFYEERINAIKNCIKVCVRKDRLELLSKEENFYIERLQIYQQIKADLERLEELEQENKHLKEMLKQEEECHKNNLKSKDVFINNQSNLIQKYQKAIEILKNKFTFNQRGDNVYIDFSEYEILYCIRNIRAIRRRLDAEETKIINEIFQFEDTVILNETQKDIIDISTELIKIFGEKQMVKAIEELSELQKELCKNLIGNSNKENIVEEIADVELMLYQIKLYYEIKRSEIDHVKRDKLERTKKRLLFDGGENE